MKSFGDLAKKKRVVSGISSLDRETATFLFRKIVKEEFGSIGQEKFFVDHFDGKTIFVRSSSSAWSSELQMNRSRIISKINKEIGRSILEDIKIK